MTEQFIVSVFGVGGMALPILTFFGMHFFFPRKED